jgi:hypothetical protein
VALSPQREPGRPDASAVPAPGPAGQGLADCRPGRLHRLGVNDEVDAGALVRAEEAMLEPGAPGIHLAPVALPLLDQETGLKGGAAH